MFNMSKIFIYCRVSSRAQSSASSPSLIAQHVHCTDIIQELLEVYWKSDDIPVVEEVGSASGIYNGALPENPSHLQPALQTLLRQMPTESTLVVNFPDRLSRNIVFFNTCILPILREKNITVCSRLSEDGCAKVLSEQELVQSIGEAQHEVMMLSRRVRARNQMNASIGAFTKRIVPLGFEVVRATTTIHPSQRIVEYRKLVPTTLPAEKELVKLVKMLYKGGSCKTATTAVKRVLAMYDIDGAAKWDITIPADKPNGKSFSGSAPDQIADFLNSLNLPKKVTAKMVSDLVLPTADANA